jgi:hypothetical protein
MRIRYVIAAAVAVTVAATAGSSAYATTTPPPSRFAYSMIQAELPNAQYGVVNEPTTDEEGGENAAYIADGDWLHFDKLNFPREVPAQAMLVRYASGARTATGTVEVRIDDENGQILASMPVSSTGGWQQWTTTRLSLSRSIGGQHDVHVIFRSEGERDFVNVNWIRFTP